MAKLGSTSSRSIPGATIGNPSETTPHRRTRPIRRPRAVGCGRRL